MCGQHTAPQYTIPRMARKARSAHRIAGRLALGIIHSIDEPTSRWSGDCLQHSLGV